MWWVLVVVSLNGPLRFWSLHSCTPQPAKDQVSRQHRCIWCFNIDCYQLWKPIQVNLILKSISFDLCSFLVPIRWCGQSQRLNFIICTSNPSVINHCHYQKLGFPIAFCFTFLFNTHFTLVHFRMSLIIIFPQKNGKGADERTIQELEDNIISVSENNSYLSKYLIDE